MRHQRWHAPAIFASCVSPTAPALPCSPLQVRWITFHSGYDFGYLLKLLTCSSLPANEAEFFALLKARWDLVQSTGAQQAGCCRRGATASSAC